MKQNKQQDLHRNKHRKNKMPFSVYLPNEEIHILEKARDLIKNELDKETISNRELLIICAQHKLEHP